ncbi:hydrolase [Psychrosphaera saromensis]|uniref:Hydrolase n=1 Tax=Psychrosphaera saromensis TaxID=716813 RepID=A0A2S7UVY7_9GAMM|nr:isochorismatase family protein [Psychrosphaera saromensis]PQJ53908.1 hydrolase [Psychrosphaera saromensis]GHB61452.1 hydrolase [Psychrosphaera saromensis]GLQ15288.1 hydrolase [Psychrosphaera saromensis]
MLTKDNTGLIVVDIQGKLARLVHDSAALIANCEKLIKGAQALELPIITLEQNPTKLGATVDELSTLLNPNKPITKFTFNGCEQAEFVDAVKRAVSSMDKDKQINTWLVCGIEAHICVYQTAMGLVDLGYKVEIVTDCISSRTLANKQLAVNKLVNNGVDITGLEMCLYELVKGCNEPEFKQILGLIR